MTNAAKADQQRALLDDLREELVAIEELVATNESHLKEMDTARGNGGATVQDVVAAKQAVNQADGLLKQQKADIKEAEAKLAELETAARKDQAYDRIRAIADESSTLAGTLNDQVNAALEAFAAALVPVAQTQKRYGDLREEWTGEVRHLGFNLNGGQAREALAHLREAGINDYALRHVPAPDGLLAGWSQPLYLELSDTIEQILGRIKSEYTGPDQFGRLPSFAAKIAGRMVSETDGQGRSYAGIAVEGGTLPGKQEYRTEPLRKAMKALEEA